MICARQYREITQDFQSKNFTRAMEGSGLSINRQRHAKAVVRVFETRWKRAPCGAAAEFNLVAPRTTSRNASLSEARALGIFLRRIVIITGIVIVAAPYVNAFAHVVKPKVVGWVGADSLRPAGFQIVAGIGSIRGKIIAPRIERACKRASSRSLPLGLARQAELFARSSAQPIAIPCCFVPVDSHHWLLGIGKHKV